jgi:hypothetical protein
MLMSPCLMQHCAGYQAEERFPEIQSAAGKIKLR